MRIKKLLKNSFIFFSPFVLILYLLYSLSIIFKDFSYGHKSHNFNPGPLNWLSYDFNIIKFKLTNTLFNRNLSSGGLKRIDLIIPEKTSNKLLENIPTSTKLYLKSKMFIDNDYLDVRMRYLGDNPYNWLFEQKSKRIKLKKDQIVNKQRFIEFKSSQNNPLLEFIAFKFAKELDLLVSEIDLVEIFINNKSNGIYLQKERLNESFLRRNKVMPINMYKGEQGLNVENKIALENDLYQNSGLWEKISVLNLVPRENKDDLKLFLKKVKKSNNSNIYLNKILDFDNLEYLTKKSILEILNQENFANFDHNQRLAIDPWSGKIFHIPHDTTFNINSINFKNLIFENIMTDLDLSLHQSSEFLNFKYKSLYEALVSDKIIENIIIKINLLKNEFLLSSKRDIGKIQRFHRYGVKVFDNEEELFDKVIKSLKFREKEILKLFDGNISCTWEKHNEDLHIKINQPLPITNLEFIFENNSIPDWIAIDYNNNNILDKDDKYFFKKNKNSFLLESLSLFSNRIPSYNLSQRVLNNKMNIVNTKFKFFTSNKAHPIKIYSKNEYNDKKFEILEDNNFAYMPSVNNIPLIKNFKERVLNFKGFIDIENDLIIEDKVKIDAGTIFNLRKGASIIFKNQVVAQGTINEPIIFRAKNNEVWGSIALHGKKTKESIFENIVIDGGSGDEIDGIYYYASLSLHKTENLTLKNIKIKDNSNYDDMVHIIYSNNLTIDNIILLNALYDAIDIDVSSNINIKKLKIENSGNDGIDIMESSVNLVDSSIINSGDKGISVGEGSSIVMQRTSIENSSFGIASKDLSKAIIKDSNFKDNKIQLSTYKKNWRYGGSGKIEVINSLFMSTDKNFFIGDDEGKIEIKNSIIKGLDLKEGNVKIN